MRALNDIRRVEKIYIGLIHYILTKCDGFETITQIMLENYWITHYTHTIFIKNGKKCTCDLKSKMENFFFESIPLDELNIWSTKIKSKVLSKATTQIASLQIYLTPKILPPKWN